MVTLPASLVMLMLSPFAKSITPPFGATSAPLADNFHKSVVFANPPSLKVNVTSSPAAAVVMYPLALLILNFTFPSFKDLAVVEPVAVPSPRAMVCAT